MAELVSVIETISNEIKRREQEISRLKELIFMLENNPSVPSDTVTKRGRKPSQPVVKATPGKRGRPRRTVAVKVEKPVTVEVSGKVSKVKASKASTALASEVAVPAAPAKKRGPKPGSKRVVKKAVSVKKVAKVAKVAKVKAAAKPKKETVLVRVLALMKSRKQFLDTAAITEALAAKYPEKDSDTLNRYLSVSLSNFKKRGDVVASKIDNGGNKYGRYFYGLPTWVDQEGSPKADFTFHVG